MFESKRFEQFCTVGGGAAILLGLYLSSLYSYLLFHSLIETVTIAVAFTLFILTWNTRKYLANNYLEILGIGYAFVAFIDLLHTLAYKGMNVFPGYGANLPTQLWIAARYLQAVTLITAPLLIKRQIDNRAVFGGFAAVVALLVATVYSGRFPDCFIEGQGLTTFKIRSEYAITALLLASLYLLFRKRKYFQDRVFFLAVASIVCTALSEISFTAYVSVYGLANLIGHFAKLAAFFLIYRAILVTGFREPFDLIFRDLKLAKEALQTAHDHLDVQVSRRTAELHAANQELMEEIKVRQEAEAALHRLNRELQAISNCNQTLMRAEEEQALLDDICRIVCDEAGYRMAWVGYAENDAGRTIRPVAWAGAEDGYLKLVGLTWADTERGRGPSGTAIRVGESVCLQDLDTDRQAAPWRDQALQRGYRSSIALPLRDESKITFGVLNIYSPMPNAFTPAEIRLLEELAGDLAFGITVLRDRLERKQAEAALRESEQRYHLVFENSPVSLWEEDFSGVKAFFDALKKAGVTDIAPYFAQHPEVVQQCAELARIVDVNQAALTLHGAANREELLAGLLNTFTDESFETFRQELVCLWNGETEMTREAVVKTLAGVPRNVAVYFTVCPGYEGTLAKVLVSLIDITENKRLAEALDMRERAYRSLVENIPDLIVRYDRNLHRIYVNPAWEKASGLSAGEVVNVPAAAIPRVSQPVVDEYLAKLRQAMETGTLQAIEFTWINARGTTLYLDYVIVPEHDQDGKVVSVLAVGRDMTERKLAEEEISKLNQELEQRVRMRTGELEQKNRELERLNRLFVGRELRMRELKERLTELEKQAGSNNA